MILGGIGSRKDFQEKEEVIIGFRKYWKVFEGFEWGWVLNKERSNSNLKKS